MSPAEGRRAAPQCACRGGSEAISAGGRACPHAPAPLGLAAVPDGSLFTFFTLRLPHEIPPGTPTTPTLSLFAVWPGRASHPHGLVLTSRPSLRPPLRPPLATVQGLRAQDKNRFPLPLRANRAHKGNF